MQRREDLDDRLGRAGALVRVDQRARAGPTSRLGPSSDWTGAVDRSAHVAALALVALHPDGHLRERAVVELARRPGPLRHAPPRLRAPVPSPPTYVDGCTMSTYLRSPLGRKDLDALADGVGRARRAGAEVRPPGLCARRRAATGAR